MELGGGESLLDGLVKVAVVEITEDELVVNKSDRKNSYRVKYSLRQTTTPKQIDLTDPDGKVYPGIYKLEDGVAPYVRRTIQTRSGRRSSRLARIQTITA